jgi:hypothetical protein
MASLINPFETFLCVCNETSSDVNQVNSSVVQLLISKRAFDYGSNFCFVFHGTFGMVLRPIL